MPITPSEAQIAAKELNRQSNSLNPSTLITLFEIDLEDIALDKGIVLTNDEKIFRFHSNIKLFSSTIYWKTYQYTAAPIEAEGFEISGKGRSPTPKLRISTNPSGIYFLSLLKQNIKRLDDLVGAKITRIRTFLSYLDANNFVGIDVPNGFNPNPNVETKDIYYVDRKSLEDKFILEFELASILDVEGIKLPARPIYANRCPFAYRGCGCNYEYAVNKTEIHESATLPLEAIGVANNRNEKITDILKIPNVIYRGKWSPNISYSKGDQIYIEKDLVKYHFVASITNTNHRPPNDTYWIQDDCNRQIDGCRLRWGLNGSVNVGNTGLQRSLLPYGGFKGTDQNR